MPHNVAAPHAAPRQQRATFRSSDSPSGQPARAVYYDGTGLNTFRTGGGDVGYEQSSGAQASPFERRPSLPNGFISTGGVTMGGAGAAYGGAYGQANPVMGVTLDSSSNVGFGNEVALVPVESNGSSRGQDVMDDNEDDDDYMPTRSLADNSDVGDSGVRAGGLRNRRGGDGRLGGGVDAGFGRRTEPDAQRATWVVVWGVPPGKSSEVLTCFLQFGHIEEQRGKPNSNWLYFK